MKKFKSVERSNCIIEKTFVKRLLNLSSILSSEKNVKKLLGLIVEELKSYLSADKVTLYILDRDRKTLQFYITGDEKLEKKTLPVDENSIAGYVALKGEVLNFPDVYQIPEDYPFHFNREIDTRTNYRTKSMIAVPMRNRMNETIGVMQILNKLKNGNAVAFDDGDREILLALSSQAAVSLENAQLYQDVEDFIVSTVRVLSTAIESRDPITAGHSLRVANYALELARARREFTDEQLRELYYAAWLHDVGKIGVREHVLLKATKLNPYQLQLIETRFDAISAREETSRLLKLLDLYLEIPENGFHAAKKEVLQKEARERISELENILHYIRKKNIASILPDEETTEIQKIGRKTFKFSDREMQLLTDEEIENLSIRKGTLTSEERKEIESHVRYTHEILKDIPFPADLRNVPLYASLHHEKLNGTGYPYGYKGDMIPTQGRILTIADIFDALVAKDRPYKKAVSRDDALKILENMVREGELDGELLQLFREQKIYQMEQEDPQYAFIAMIQKRRMPYLA